MPTQAHLAREVAEALVPRGRVHLLVLNPMPCNAAGDPWEYDDPGQATHIMLNPHHACNVHGRVRTSHVPEEVTCKVCQSRQSYAYHMLCPPSWLGRTRVTVDEYVQQHSRFW